MELDKMLFARLSNDAGLAELLTVFGDRPAVFFQRVQPPDNKKWTGKQFPRIVYSIDYQGEPARQTSGQLVVEVMCDVNFGAEPETIASRLQGLLHSSFAFADDYPYCFSWLKSDPVEMVGNGADDIRTIGVLMLFDIIAFPEQLTSGPDPIKGINEWTKAILPDSTVIGVDAMDGWVIPTSGEPIIYWRLAGQSLYQEWHTHSWLDIALEGHVYAPDAQDRLKVVSYIQRSASITRHVRLDDDSPLFVREVVARPHLNPMAPGQLLINGRFGVLKTRSESGPLNNIKLKTKVG
jgi:hypothetical protein